ncbi:hypothetical protein DW728_08605 [Streptococcus parasanguinis]|nr:hypothetical protein DW728_08605 [Streptococcus parasanguinis]
MNTQSIYLKFSFSVKNNKDKIINRKEFFQVHYRSSFKKTKFNIKTPSEKFWWGFWWGTNQF